MKPNAPFLASLLFVLTFSLTGCADLGLRKGISPVLDASAVETAAMNQGAIIDALAREAGYPHPEDPSTVNYYDVARAGFNYVDDQCRSYFDEMFFIDRGRSQVKSGLAAASATTAAILGVTNASTLTMSVVASAFGFASSATDIVSGTYLYALPPATTEGLVSRLQAKYRDDAAKAQGDINSRTEAYYRIQTYLALCLPPRIEAEIVNAVNGATIVKGARTFLVQGAPPPAPPEPRAPQQRAPQPRAPQPRAPQPTAPQAPVQPTVVKVTVTAIDSVFSSMQTQLAAFDKQTPLSTLQKNVDLANSTQGVPDSQKKNLANDMKTATAAHASMIDAVQSALSLKQAAQRLKDTTDIGARATDLVNQANQARTDFDRASAQFQAAKTEIMNFAL
jgi:hypothetical protein